MTTRDVVWAMQVRAHHNVWCYAGPMDKCTESCREADRIITKDHEDKNRATS